MLIQVFFCSFLRLLFSPGHGCGPRASYCEAFLRQYTCWLLRSHSSQQPAKTLPEKHPQHPRPSRSVPPPASLPLSLSLFSSPCTSTCESGTVDDPRFSCPALWWRWLEDNGLTHLGGGCDVVLLPTGPIREAGNNDWVTSGSWNQPIFLRYITM